MHDFNSRRSPMRTSEHSQEIELSALETPERPLYSLTFGDEVPDVDFPVPRLTLPAPLMNSAEVGQYHRDGDSSRDVSSTPEPSAYLVTDDEEALTANGSLFQQSDASVDGLSDSEACGTDGGNRVSIDAKASLFQKLAEVYGSTEHSHDHDPSSKASLFQQSGTFITGLSRAEVSRAEAYGIEDADDHDPSTDANGSLLQQFITGLSRYPGYAIDDDASNTDANVSGLDVGLKGMCPLGVDIAAMNAEDHSTEHAQEIGEKSSRRSWSEVEEESMEHAQKGDSENPLSDDLESQVELREEIDSSAESVEGVPGTNMSPPCREAVTQRSTTEHAQRPSFGLTLGGEAVMDGGESQGHHSQNLAAADDLKYYTSHQSIDIEHAHTEVNSFEHGQSIDDTGDSLAHSIDTRDSGVDTVDTGDSLAQSTDTRDSLAQSIDTGDSQCVATTDTEGGSTEHAQNTGISATVRTALDSVEQPATANTEVPVMTSTDTTEVTALQKNI